MKEYKITAESLRGSFGQDCYLSPDDPVWELMGKQPKQIKKFGNFIAEVTHKDINNDKKS